MHVTYIKNGGMRLKEFETAILGLVAQRPTCGYDLARRLRATLPKSISQGEGVIYPILHALERAGSVVAEWVQVTEERRRRIYATPTGQTISKEAGYGIQE